MIFLWFFGDFLLNFYGILVFQLVLGALLKVSEEGKGWEI